MRRVCVFCGSSPGRRDEYRLAAARLGTELGRRDIGLVYGGASIGLMGVVADAAREAGGEVIGGRRQRFEGLAFHRQSQSIH